MTPPQSTPAGATASERGLRLPLLPTIWALLLGFALLARIAALDTPPLAPDEAARALEARSLLRGSAGQASVGPIPVHLMAIWFWLFTPADGPARAPAALLGWSVCLVPLLFARRLGSAPALIAGALLTLSPLELLASRTAAPAAFVLLAAGLLAGSLLRAAEANPSRWLPLAALAVALGLGSGAAFVGQMLALGLAAALFPPFRDQGLLTGRSVRHTLVVLLISALLLDTLLLTRPSGLQAGLVDPFAAWSSSLGLGPPGLVGTAALLLAELPLILTLLVGLRFTLHDQIGRFLLAWALATLTLAALSRSPDLATTAGAILPLALLAGRGLTALAARLPRPDGAIWLTAAALLVPIGYVFVTITGQVYRGAPFVPATVLVASGGLVAIILLASTWQDLREIRAAVLLALAAGLLALQLNQLTGLNFSGYQRAAPALLNRSTSPAVRGLERRVAEWWRQSPNEPIEVDLQLRPLLEWSLRDGARVEWISTAPRRPDRAILGPTTATARPAAEWVRLVVAERFFLPNQPPGWQAFWRWLVVRESFFRSEPDAILVTL